MYFHTAGSVTLRRCRILSEALRLANLSAPKNEFESRLQLRKNDVVSRVELDSRVLEGQTLFDIRSVYLAELERNKLPYTELDTKAKFIDMIVFLTRRKLEAICIAAAEARVCSEEELARFMARIDEVEADWQEKLSSREKS